MSVKLALLKSGEDVIADFQEMVVDGKVVGYLAKDPYVVKLNRSDIPNEEEPLKLGLSFFPWMPLSKQTDIPMDPQWMVTMVDPVDEVKQSYEEKVNVLKERREGNHSDERDQSDSGD